MTLATLLFIYIAFRIKQFSCDFLLQTDWMALTKGKPGIEGYKALFSHAAVHGAATTLIALVFVPSMWWLGPLDFLVHAFVDRVKGILSYRKGWSYENRWFWWSFGLDQEAHNFSNLAYIILIVVNSGGLEI